MRFEEYREGMPEITDLLVRVRQGDETARHALVPLVYADLEIIARAQLRGSENSLEPRGLVHELYLKLARSPIDARDRKHFFAAAALAMRQILIDRARRRHADKRGGQVVHVTLSLVPNQSSEVDLVAVDDALRRLEELSPRQARVVEMRCLLGLSVAETAAALDISERTVRGDWRVARAWLTDELRPR
jgi:RNA polymerase sigma factor (TIGR02999 family)